MSNNNSMAEQDLYQDIIDNQKTESKVSQEEKKISTWLVFKSEESVYAIESVYIKEILNNNDIFAIPFMPSYISGVLNFYGKPYAVIDFQSFLNSTKTSKKMFMILDTDDDVAIQISDVIDFYNSNEVVLQPITNNTDNDNFSQALVSIREDLRAPVLNVNSIIKKVKKEIDSV